MIVIDYKEVSRIAGQRLAQLEVLIHHIRHCRECGETDVMNCFEGRKLWEEAGMPKDGTVESSSAVAADQTFGEQMKKYTFIELVQLTLTGAEEFYIAAETEGRIDELERALKSACIVMSRMRQSHYELGNIARQAFKEAEKALPDNAAAFSKLVNHGD